MNENKLSIRDIFDEVEKINIKLGKARNVMRFAMGNLDDEITAVQNRPEFAEMFISEIDMYYDALDSVWDKIIGIQEAAEKLAKAIAESKGIAM